MGVGGKENLRCYFREAELLNLPAVVSLSNRRQFQPPICAASNIARRSASVKKQGTLKMKTAVFFSDSCMFL